MTQCADLSDDIWRQVFEQGASAAPFMGATPDARRYSLVCRRWKV
jgi:hypothetical protein